MYVIMWLGWYGTDVVPYGFEHMDSSLFIEHGEEGLLLVYSMNLICSSLSVTNY